MRLNSILNHFQLVVGQFLGSSGTLLYEGANTSRERTPVPYWATDSKRDLTRFTRLQLLSAARWLYANDGYTRGAIRDMARYSIGPGLIPQALTSDENWNSEAEAYWREWCKIADVGGKHNFNRLQRILSIAMDRDGDVGLLMLRSSNGLPQLQLIEGHRIGTDFGWLTDLTNGSEWVDGVRLNNLGRPIEYRISEPDLSMPGGVGYRDIPAYNFIHLFDAERADQARGITSLYHAINTLHDRKDILDFEKLGVKKNSAQWAVLKTKSGDADPADWDDEEVEIDGKTIKIAKSRGGEVKLLSTDEDLTPWEANRPSPAFAGFIEHLLRDVSVGLGLPYEFIWNPEKLGGTSQRFVLEKAQRRFAERQQQFASMLLDRIWFWVMSVGIKRKDISPAPKNQPWLVRWQGPAEVSVDAGRDSQADREDLKMGLTTESTIYARQGLDYTEQRNQREREVDDLLMRAGKLAKKHKIELSMALQLLQQTTPNGNPNQSGNQQDKQKSKQ